METCVICKKRRDEMAMLNVLRVDEVLDAAEGEIKFHIERICVWCAEAKAATRELYPDSDNLVGCPKCGNDMLRTQAICSHCKQELQAYYS